ncbi:actin beta/gamma 1/actin [Pseudomonas asturiensis]|uniref:Actin beta/gamma 1/actin n=1 Tax=Pseudomonas asturiensis TaxID=1190415 RepID=A0A1M7P152_9PSED|nr:actin family protein [Pseudomonas asturiensis]SHN10232.1 actin beta/gamma 1/actin [Pseudomonas asturiensis]
MEDDLSGKAVIIDMGSGFTKVGFAGDKSPKAVFPTVVGRPKAATGLKTVYVGDEALSGGEALDLRNPVKFGVVNNSDDFEKLIEYVFSTALKIEKEKQPVLLTESPLPPKANREYITQIMFESHCCTAFYLAKDANLSLYASGRTTGIVVDIGDDMTCVAAVFEGFMYPHTVLKREVGGRDLTNYLAQLLDTAEPDFKNLQSRFSIAKDIKEKLGNDAPNLASKLQAASSTVDKFYELPNGKKINLADERFNYLEELLQRLFDSKGPYDLHNTIHQSILKCDEDIQKDLWGNIVLSGGSAMFKGLGNRLQKELSALAPAGTTVSVTVPPDCRYASWIGGAMLADLPTFQQMWITRDEYDESGPAIVHRKCC